MLEKLKMRVTLGNKHSTIMLTYEEPNTDVNFRRIFTGTDIM